MKVLHVIPSLSPSQGGPSLALPLMAESLRARGWEVNVATTDDDGPGKRNAEVPNATHVFPKQTEFYKVSLPMLWWLMRNVQRYEVVHIHALFSFSSTAAAWVARLRGVPYILRPLGVLNHYGMTQRRPWMKRLSYWLLEGPILKHAAAMHYTSKSERDEAAANGATRMAAVIPLGLKEPPKISSSDIDTFFRQHPSAVGRELVLFLSRLDEKKGLELLFEAMQQVQHQRPAALLLVAGKGTAEYEARLKQLAKGIEVLWLGHLEGLEKEAAFAVAHLFVLTSHSENFGIAPVEAVMRGLPALLSKEVAVSEELATEGACEQCVLDARDIASKIIHLIKDEALRKKLGETARRVSSERYSLQTMSARLEKLYNSLRKNS